MSRVRWIADREAQLAEPAPSRESAHDNFVPVVPTSPQVLTRPDVMPDTAAPEETRGWLPREFAPVPTREQVISVEPGFTPAPMEPTPAPQPEPAPVEPVFIPEPSRPKEVIPAEPEPAPFFEVVPQMPVMVSNPLPLIISTPPPEPGKEPEPVPVLFQPPGSMSDNETIEIFELVPEPEPEPVAATPEPVTLADPLEQELLEQVLTSEEMPLPILAAGIAGKAIGGKLLPGLISNIGQKLAPKAAPVLKSIGNNVAQAVVNNQGNRPFQGASSPATLISGGPPLNVQVGRRPWYQQPAGIIGIVVGAIVIIGGLFLAFRRKRR